MSDHLNPGIIEEGVDAYKACMASSLPHNLDRVVAGAASLLPMGLVLGNVAFESAVGLTGLVWLVRNLCARDKSLERISKHALTIPMAAWMVAVLLSRVVNGYTFYLFFHDLAFVRYLLFMLAVHDVAGRLPLDRYLLIGLPAASCIRWLR